MPLEKNTVRFLDNFSTGTRGSSSAEAFVDQRYAVVFLHRDTSLRPYVRNFAPLHLFADVLSASDDRAAVGCDSDTPAPIVRPSIEKAVALGMDGYTAAVADGRLLEISFRSVVEYLHLLK